MKCRATEYNKQSTKLRESLLGHTIIGLRREELVVWPHESR